MAGPRGHVLINGHGHELDPGSGADIVTWSLGFFAAWVNGDAAAKSKLDAGRSASKAGSTTARCSMSIRPAGALGPARWSTRSSTTTRRSTTTSSPRSPKRRRRSTPAFRRAGSAPATRSAAGNRERSRQRGVPVLRHAGRRPELALLHDQHRRMREGEGESRLDVRGVRVSRDRAARERLRAPVHDGHPPVQQRHGRTGESSLPDRSARQSTPRSREAGWSSGRCSACRGRQALRAAYPRAAHGRIQRSFTVFPDADDARTASSTS